MIESIRGGALVEMVVQDTDYMESAAPCFQWKDEFRPLLALYAKRKPKRVLEVGTYHGGTLFWWLQCAQKGTTVVSLDSYLVGVDNRHLYSGWVPDGVQLEVLAGDSRKPKVIERVREFGPYDWIFIDAGHYYEEVASDWHNYKTMAAEGAVVVLHDILPPSRTWPDIQVWWLWKELKREGLKTEEIISDPEAEWGGLGIVYL